MNTRNCVFYSDGIRLDGLLQLPDRASRGNRDRRPAIILCSGFRA